MRRIPLVRRIILLTITPHPKPIQNTNQYNNPHNKKQIANVFLAIKNAKSLSFYSSIEKTLDSLIAKCKQYV
ncbi:hypothetical protein AL535_012685 [Vibrio cholerae]|nr:hypothetical protein AL535_012685 [Vibrio cholerae]